MKSSLLIKSLIVFLFPLASFAKYDSKTALLKAFKAAGYDYVIEMPSGDFSSEPKMKVHVVEGETVNTVKFTTFAHGEEKRIEELDYVENTQALLSQAIHGDIYAGAYEVADILLCYRLPASYIQEFKHETPKYISCYMFPTRVSEVVRAVRAVAQIQ